MPEDRERVHPPFEHGIDVALEDEQSGARRFQSVDGKGNSRRIAGFTNAAFQRYAPSEHALYIRYPIGQEQRAAIKKGTAEHRSFFVKQ